MNPYPSNSDLHIEMVADQLLTEQAADTAKYVAALRAFDAAISPLQFPLGSPVQGYDWKDILCHTADWRCLRDDPSERDAIEMAREMT